MHRALRCWDSHSSTPSLRTGRENQIPPVPDFICLRGPRLWGFKGKGPIMGCRGHSTVVNLVGFRAGTPVGSGLKTSSFVVFHCHQAL